MCTKVGCRMISVENGMTGKMTMQKAQPMSCLGDERSADMVMRWGLSQGQYNWNRRYEAVPERMVNLPQAFPIFLLVECPVDEASGIQRNSHWAYHYNNIGLTKK